MASAASADPIYVAYDGDAGSDGSIEALATTLDHAMSLAQSGDEVVIAGSASTYAPASTVAVTAGVTVRGATGDWDDVVISGSNRQRAATVTGAGAVLSGVTLIEGYIAGDGKPGPGAYVTAGGVLANSLVHDNTYDGATTSFIGGVNAVGGSVVNCIIS